MARVSRPKTLTYAERATKYARDVAAGRIAACKWVRLAAERHLDDLKRSKTRAFPYKFDPDRAHRACAFAERMPHVKGKWAKETLPIFDRMIVLGEWQVFILASVFGWVQKKTGLRRFRLAYWEIARKNAKSTLAAVIGELMLSADGEPGAEVYSCATTEKQAWETFRPGQLMAQKSPGFAAHFAMDVRARSIFLPETGSRWEPVIGKPGDGASPHCALVDEYHEHKTADAFHTMLTGMGARSHPLAVVTTTAGDDTGGPCYDLRDEVCKVLEGTVTDETIFGMIFTIDEGDDWTVFDNWYKANPNLGVSVDEGYLRAQLAMAVRRASQQNAIKRKHLNVWTTARTAYFNLEEWNACADLEMRPSDFRQEDGWRCYVGTDYGSRRDLAATVRVFARQRDDGKNEYAIFPTLYLPETTVQEPANDRYRGWVNGGHVVETDGNECDFARIEADIAGPDGFSAEHSIAELAYEPWNAIEFAQRMQAQGVGVVEFRMTTQNFTGPMKELDAAIGSGRVRHDGNPCFAWMMSNVTAKPDANDNVFPRKDRGENKIDGPVAAMMAIGRAMAGEGDEPSVFETIARGRG